MTNRDDWTRKWLGCLLGTVCALTVQSPKPAFADETPARVLVDADGTIHAPAMVVPTSSYLSPEGRAYMAEHLHQMQTPALLTQNDGVPVFMEGYLERQHELFAFKMSDTKLAGVHVYDYAPSGGIAPQNRNRVLINLHGGGFSGCFPRVRGIGVDTDNDAGKDSCRQCRLSAGAGSQISRCE